MEAVCVIVAQVVNVRQVYQVRSSLPWIFLLLSLFGSFLKEINIIPHTYFSISSNIFNLYLVKLSWGWTLLLLTPFIVLSSRGSSSLGRRLCAVAVATLLWYVCTEGFSYLEEVTGSCHDGDQPKPQFPSKASCREARFHWSGFDISGHSFILPLSSLLILQETAPMASVTRPSAVLSLLYLALNLLVCVWLWMFACTSVYFHHTSHKLLGTLLGLLAWKSTETLRPLLSKAGEPRYS